MRRPNNSNNNNNEPTIKQQNDRSFQLLHLRCSFVDALLFCIGIKKHTLIIDDLQLVQALLRAHNNHHAHVAERIPIDTMEYVLILCHRSGLLIRSRCWSECNYTSANVICKQVIQHGVYHLLGSIAKRSCGGRFG